MTEIRVAGNIDQVNDVGFSVDSATGKMWLYVNGSEIESTSYSGTLHDGAFDLARANANSCGFYHIKNFLTGSYSTLKQYVRDDLATLLTLEDDSVIELEDGSYLETED